MVQILNVVVFTGAFVTNYLNAATNGNKQGEIADQRDITLQPEKWAFRIWTFIYLGLAAFTVYQALPESWVKEKRNNHLIYNKIEYSMAIALTCSVGWIFTF